MRAVMEALSRAIPDPGIWWPADTRFEMIAGAVLTQNTSWAGAEKAVGNLKKADLLTVRNLSAADPELIRQAIVPCGYWRTKTLYLKEICAWFAENNASAPAMDDASLRASLLGVRGVGEETADDIILYAYRRGTFIYDVYARRMLRAVGWGEYKTYAQARRSADSAIRGECFTVEEYSVLHGLIVQAGKDARKAGGWDAYRRSVLCL